MAVKALRKKDKHDVAVYPILWPLSCSQSQTHGATACHFPHETQLCSFQAKTNELRSPAQPEMVQTSGSLCVCVCLRVCQGVH